MIAKVTDMLQTPKAGAQTLEQDPQERGSIYFSLENQINLVQASQRPDKTIKIHRKVVLCDAMRIINEIHKCTKIDIHHPMSSILQTTH